MDYIIEDNAKLLNELIEILYEDDPHSRAFEAFKERKGQL